jgi:hypothetical protein
MAVSDSLYSLLDHERLLFYVTDLVLIYESVTSSASVVRWLALHSWTLNYLWAELNWTLLLKPRGEPKIGSHLEQFVYYCVYSLKRECVFGEPLASNGLPRLFVAAGTCYRTVA